MISTILEQGMPAGTFGLHMRIATLFVLLTVGLHLFAQDDMRLFKPSIHSVDSTTPPTMAMGTDDALLKDSITPGVVTVVESDRIKALMADYAARKRPLDGYRVQIFLGDRAQAENTRRSFLLQHPDVPAYLSYLAPNFRVRVGDLRDRVEAEGLRENLKGEFPGLYVVPDQIELPKLPTADN